MRTLWEMARDVSLECVGVIAFAFLGYGAFLAGMHLFTLINEVSL